MSETPISDHVYIYDNQLLIDLLDALQPFLANHSKTKFYGEVAKRLSACVGKNPPWKWRYIHGVANFTVAPSFRLLEACEILAASLDGIPLEIAKLRKIEVYGIDSQILPNSIVYAPSRECNHPGCLIRFIPVVPNQVKCRLHQRRRKQNALD